MPLFICRECKSEENVNSEGKTMALLQIYTNGACKTVYLVEVKGENTQNHLWYSPEFRL